MELDGKMANLDIFLSDKQLLGNVSLDMVVHTDSWRSYDGLVDVG